MTCRRGSVWGFMVKEGCSIAYIDGVGELSQGLRTYFDDLVSWEVETGNVGCVTGHQVAVQNAQDGFVGNDEKIILFTFEFEDDGFEADGKVMIGLQSLVSDSSLDSLGYFHLICGSLPLL